MFLFFLAGFSEARQPGFVPVDCRFAKLALHVFLQGALCSGDFNLSKL